MISTKARSLSVSIPGGSIPAAPTPQSTPEHPHFMNRKPAAVDQQVLNSMLDRFSGLHRVQEGLVKLTFTCVSDELMEPVEPEDEDMASSSSFSSDHSSLSHSSTPGRTSLVKPTECDTSRMKTTPVPFFDMDL